MTIHCSRNTVAFLCFYIAEFIELENWPRNSTDLNPIDFSALDNFKIETVTPCTRACIPVLQVCGLVLFGLGFILYIDRESQLHGQLLHMLPSSGPLITLDKIPAVLAGTGTTILLLSFLGCYGACVESVCFLWLVGFHGFHCYSKCRNKIK